MIVPVYVAVRTIRGDWPEQPRPIVQETTLYSFDPVPTAYLDERDPDGFGRTVRVEGGDDPTYWVVAPDGQMVRSQGKSFLKTARQKCMDASDALYYARIKAPGMSLRRPAPAPPRSPEAPAPEAPTSPARQGGFGWD